MPNVARFDAGTLKLQRMIKWDVFGTRCRCFVNVLHYVHTANPVDLKSYCTGWPKKLALLFQLHFVFVSDFTSCQA